MLYTRVQYRVYGSAHSIKLVTVVCTCGSACVGRLLSELKLDLIAAMGVKGHARLGCLPTVPRPLGSK